MAKTLGEKLNDGVRAFGNNSYSGVGDFLTSDVSFKYAINYGIILLVVFLAQGCVSVIVDPYGNVGIGVDVVDDGDVVGRKRTTKNIKNTHFELINMDTGKKEMDIYCRKGTGKCNEQIRSYFKIKLDKGEFPEKGYGTIGSSRGNSFFNEVLIYSEERGMHKAEK